MKSAKKTLVLILIAAMVFTMLPLSALAEAPPADGVEAENVALAYDDDNDRYLAIYTLVDESWYYYLVGRFLGPDGAPIGDPFLLAKGIAADDYLYGDVAYDSVNDRFLVAYEIYYDADEYSELRACFIDGDGTVGESFPIGEGAGTKAKARRWPPAGEASWWRMSISRMTNVAYMSATFAAG